MSTHPNLPSVGSRVQESALLPTSASVPLIALDTLTEPTELCRLQDRVPTPCKRTGGAGLGGSSWEAIEEGMFNARGWQDEMSRNDGGWVAADFGHRGRKLIARDVSCRVIHWHCKDEGGGYLRALSRQTTTSGNRREKLTNDMAYRPDIDWACV